MLITVPLCGICFISVVSLISENVCPIFMACVAKLNLEMSVFSYALKCPKWRFCSFFLAYVIVAFNFVNSIDEVENVLFVRI